MEPIGEAIKYPMNRDNWIPTVVIGGVLGFLGIFLIPLFLIGGLLIKAMRTTMAGDPVPPEFDDWGDLLVDGVLAFVIGLIYMLIPLVLFTFVIGSTLVGAVFGGEEGVLAVLTGAIFGFFVVGLIMLIFQYVMLVGIVNFAREGRFGAAFDFDVIRDVGTSGDYLVAFLIVVGLYIATGIVTSIPLIGWLLSPFIAFYVALVAARLLASGFDEARQTA